MGGWGSCADGAAVEDGREEGERPEARQDEGLWAGDARLHYVILARRPPLTAHGPPPATLAVWNRLPLIKVKQGLPPRAGGPVRATERAG